MKNKEKYNLAHLHIVERAGATRLDGYITYVEIEYNGKIVKEYACTNEAGIKKFLEWLEEEYKEPILNDVEKAYLSAVIKPFREKVETIEKASFEEDEQLQISDGDTVMAFPCFEKGTMYKGMEAYKAYTLEELGL